mgnify:CR=1 FL=1
MEIFARNTGNPAHAHLKMINIQYVYNLLMMHFRNCIFKKRFSPIITQESNVLIPFFLSDVAQKTSARLLPIKILPNKAFSSKSFLFKALPSNAHPIKAIQVMSRLFTRVDARTCAVRGASVGNAGIDGRADGSSECSQCSESDELGGLNEPD